MWEMDELLKLIISYSLLKGLVDVHTAGSSDPHLTISSFMFILNESECILYYTF